ncbi:nucleotide-diphospho-sugar transferase [Pedobacter sp. MW01-1-1]|uniref:nucleotide-diphospho-sugar transferase n=1 Tax=Pedobacter sp. MW01-1-1 TaxID=3383027 RepID=UPI003FED812E
MSMYQVKSSILFLVFNRPDITSRVFEAIREVKPTKLYVAADGPRDSYESDFLLCKETRDSIKVDWPCELITLYRDKNHGCKEAVSSAIGWFFEQEDEGIILEDDCLPAVEFFSFCDELLEKYRFDTRIRHIAGSDHQLGKKWGNSSYYFANQTHVWGWASWKRVWKDYDKELSLYTEDEAYVHFDNIFTDRFVNEDWKRIFTNLKNGKIDTWDYQMALINYFNNGLSINPNGNLISNIGFRTDGTHTTSSNSPYANLPFEAIGTLMHPLYILPEKDADYAVFNRDFSLEIRWKKYNLLRRKIKRWLKSKLSAK